MSDPGAIVGALRLLQEIAALPFRDQLRILPAVVRSWPARVWSKRGAAF